MSDLNETLNIVVVSSSGFVVSVHEKKKEEKSNRTVTQREHTIVSGIFKFLVPLQRAIGQSSTQLMFGT